MVSLEGLAPQGSQKKASDPLELELQMCVSHHHVGARSSNPLPVLLTAKPPLQGPKSIGLKYPLSLLFQCFGGFACLFVWFLVQGIKLSSF